MESKKDNSSLQFSSQCCWLSLESKPQQLADNNYILTSKEEYFPLGQLLPRRNPRSLTPA